MTTRVKIVPAELVLCVIDVQERLAAAMEFKVREHVSANIRRLLALARETAIPVVVTEQYPAGLGVTLPEIHADVPDGTITIEKSTFSAWPAEDYRQKLAGLGRKTIVLTGMEAHVCVLQTAIDLMENGYRVFVVQDACSSRAAANWKVGLRLMEIGGALITSTETVMFQVLGRAGTSSFKTMQPWIK